MLLGLRFRVWMPSFFMLNGRLTCTQDTRGQTVILGRSLRPSDSADGETPRNLPPRGPIIL